MFKRILVPVDGSAASSAGLRAAIEIARRHKARLRLVHLGNRVPAAGRKGEGMTVGQLAEAMKKEGEKLLAKHAGLCKARHIRTDTALYISLAARPAKVVVKEATAWGAELIVVGTHGRRGLARLALGSDAEQIIRASPVPVLLVRSLH